MTDPDPEQMQARIDLAACHRLAAWFGYNEGIDNHFTLLVPEQAGQFFLAPFGLHWSEVRASDFLIVGFDGQIHSGSGPVEDTAFHIHAPILGYLPKYLEMERGFSKTEMATVVSGAYLVNALAALFGGWAIDKAIKAGWSPSLVCKGRWPLLILPDWCACLPCPTCRSPPASSSCSSTRFSSACPARPTS